MSTTETITWNAPALAQIASNEAGQPILFTNARIVSLDPQIGTLTGDVLLGGPVIVGVGPGLVTAAGDDDMIVVDATGTTVLPAVLDTPALVGARARRADDVATITPGNPADLLIVPDDDAADVPTALATLLTRPQRVRALVVAGMPVRWDGAELPTGHTFPAAGVPAAQDMTGMPHVGVWVDQTDFLHQELTADGRYDETRGGRPHASQGSYWVEGDRVDYLDDLGFWAYGEFRGDELHHAGYVMRLR
jgi:Agrobacterium tumefaciens protein Atu4866